MRKSIWKKIALMAAGAILATGLSACGNRASETGATTAAAETAGANGSAAADAVQETADGDGKTTVRVCVTADPGSLGVFDEGSSNGRNSTLLQVYEKLAVTTPENEVKGVLLKDWYKDEENSTDDNVIYHLELWDSIYDTAGNHLTASDVVFCLNEMKENGAGTAHTVLAGYMKSITALDDYHLELVMNSTAIGKLEQILDGAFIVTQAAYEASENGMATQPVATGPYEVVSWTTGSGLVLGKNEDYWQKDESVLQAVQKANVDRIEYSIVTETAQQTIGLETNTLDVVSGINYLNAQRFMEGGESAEGFTVSSKDESRVQNLWLNRSEDSPLNDLRIAQACLYAIDNQAILDGAADGMGTVVNCFGSANCVDYLEKWDDEDYYGYDPEKAQELLAEAGHHFEDFKLKILCDNDEMRVKIAQIIQQYLLAAGIDSEVCSFESALWSTYQQDTTQYDINVSLCPASSYLPKTWEQLNGDNYSEHALAGVNDPEMNRLLKEAELVHTDESLDAAHRYMTDNAQVYGLFIRNMFFVTRDSVVEKPVFNVSGYCIPGAMTYAWN